MERMNLTVRNAEFEDMKLLGHVMSVSFKTAFADFVSEKTMEENAREDSCIALLEGVYREGNVRFLVGGDSGMLVWQATEVGAEILAIHTLPESWGTGLGAALLTEALKQIGEQPVFLWAFRENHRARRFYEKHGFRWDGAQRVSEFDEAIEVRYVRE